MIAARIGCLLAAALTLGCATDVIVYEELPEAPLAFVYRTLAQGRERADRLKDLRGEKVTTGDGTGIMDLKAAADYLEGLRGEPQGLSAELRGRLALLDPNTQRVDVIDAFVAGSLPADWSRDRDRLLAVSRQRGSAQLYEYSTSRGDLAPAVRGYEERVRGAYGPDGRLAIVQAERVAESYGFRIWVTDPGGSGARPLTDGPADQNVRWSPDGRWLLYQGVLRNGRGVIKALDLVEGGEPRIIARGIEPAISPLGDWVVYSRQREAGWRLWRMRIDGTGKSALGQRPQGQADERNPTISPDGRYVAYVAQQDDRQRIRVRRIDGSGDRLLLEAGDGTLPVW